MRIASALLLGLGGILGVNAGLALLYREDVVESTAQDLPAYVTTDQLDTIVLTAGGVLVALAALLITAGLNVRRGRQWARVLAFVAAGLVITLATVGALAGGGLLAVVLLGAAVGAVAFLMQASVAPYFTRPH